jgi:hypothetical protein
MGGALFSVSGYIVHRQLCIFVTQMQLGYAISSSSVTGKTICFEPRRPFIACYRTEEF